MSRRLILLLSIVRGLLPPNPVEAMTIRVPQDFPTIQQGIGAASAGDIVLVAAGVYVENLDFLGKAVTVTSEQGPAVTTIDGNLIGSVVAFTHGETLTSVLSGFTLKRGRAAFGAGITLLGASATITHNVFDSNEQTAGGFGAGIGGNGSSPVVDSNVFRNNSCDGQFLSGVVSFVNTSSPRVVNNIFENNPCRGINMALPTGNAPKTINNTLIGNNTGIRVDRRVDASGQVYENNILVGNGVGLQVDFGVEANNPTWKRNDVFNNATNYLGILDQTGVNGNISADPLLWNSAGGNYHLQAGSPAIDAGDNAAPGLPAKDFDGGGRIVDGNGDGTAVVDMGAEEFHNCPGTGPYRLRGKVKMAGTPLAGVTLSLSGPGNCGEGAATDNTGTVTFKHLSNGTYLVAPRKAGCSFRPADRTVAIAGHGGKAKFVAKCP
jgi:hypothetical protein